MKERIGIRSFRHIVARDGSPLRLLHTMADRWAGIFAAVYLNRGASARRLMRECQRKRELMGLMAASRLISSL